MSKPFVLYRNTKDRCEDEHESEMTDKMNEDAEAIDFDDFAKECEYEEVAKELGYSDDDLPLKDDWSVSFQQSKFGGCPCYILGHTECDFIFLKPADAEMLASFYGREAQGMTLLEWKRVTGYGKNQTPT